MSYLLGLGRAKVTIDITRADGTVDRVELETIEISSTEDATIDVREVDEPMIRQKTDEVSRAADLEVGLQISGRILHTSEDGAYIRVQQGVTP